MIYDPNSGALYRADGKFLKTVYCPMTIRLNEMEKVAPDSPDRRCHACGETVNSIDNLSEDEVAKLVNANPDICVFATAQARNVIFLKKTARFCIYTANRAIMEDKNRSEMYQALYKALGEGVAKTAGLIGAGEQVIKDTGISNEFGKFKFQLLQNTKTGELLWTGDYRSVSAGGDDWEIKKSFTCVRPDRPFPLAAYLIPPDLPVDTNVFVEDLIQDIKMVIWNQGDASRVVATSGIWNGADITFNEESFSRPLFQG